MTRMFTDVFSPLSGTSAQEHVYNMPFKERERQEKERLQERAHQEQEKLLQEMERLQALLRQSGIDPAQAE